MLVAETYTLLPLGFAMCVWGARVGRLVAALCAAASVALAVAAAVTLSSPQSSFLYGLPFLVVPGLALLACVVRMRLR